MRRVLFQWRSFTVWSYPAMLYVGLVAGVMVGNLAAHAAGVDAFAVFVATLLLIAPAIVGARLLYVAANWSQYHATPSRIWDRSEGGMAMHGGMPVMLLLSAPVLPLLGLGFGEFWDVAGLTIMAGVMFTKIGCLLNGCCAGRPSSSRFAVYLPGERGESRKRVPVQCLEACWAALVLAGGSLLLGRMPFQGALFLLVAALYSAGRLYLETLREPERGAGRFSIGSAFSAVTITASLAVLLLWWPK
jgi:phosphatidylglycerol:prolipoprotein diacylglycerol transferase